MAIVLALAGVMRFHDLGRSAVRSDEISFLFRAQENMSLVELWKNPPWFNQIPLADSIPIVWARLTRLAPDEGRLRQPFALLGTIAVMFCSGWMMRRRGAWAGLLMGTWMAVLPFHVYHSREAYYYVPAMLFAAGMTLRGMDFAVQRSRGEALLVRQYAEWTAWALLTCLCHMSAWVVAGTTFAIVGTSGWKQPGRGRHLAAMGLVAVAMSAGMARWVLRALHEMRRAAADPETHIGAAFDWVGPRVLPFFVGGANWVGIGLLAAIAAAAAWTVYANRGRPWRNDPMHGALFAGAVTGLAGSYAYIAAAGGGDKAKLAYFAANLPIFLALAVWTLDKAIDLAAGKRKNALKIAAIVAVAGTLLVPSIHVLRLEGKTTAYRALKAWLDNNLSPGDVAYVDRWYEPWNEMRMYAPTNVHVSFTVPDEPFDNYVNYGWRQRTQTAIMGNDAQAFIRLTRNHEQRMGLWTWPETWFRNRAVVTNQAGVWLRDTGFAPLEEFYMATNRLETEIFYDTREDAMVRARARGQKIAWFYGRGWGLFKPWQQGDFSDYRILQGTAEMDVRLLDARVHRVRVEIDAAAAGGGAAVQIGKSEPMTFPGGQIATQIVELELEAGGQPIEWKTLEEGAALFVRDVRISPALRGVE